MSRWICIISHDFLFNLPSNTNYNVELVGETYESVENPIKFYLTENVMCLGIQVITTLSFVYSKTLRQVCFFIWNALTFHKVMRFLLYKYWFFIKLSEAFWIDTRSFNEYILIKVNKSWLILCYCFCLQLP